MSWARSMSGAATSSDSLVIRWPSGTVQAFADLSGVDVELTISEDQVTPTETLPPDGGPIPSAPLVTRLVGNRPNPFNPLTTIHYTVPQAGRVTLTVYDIGGRRVDTLVAGEYLEPNAYAVRYQPQLASGQYSLRLEVGGHVRTQRLTLLQ